MLNTKILSQTLIISFLVMTACGSGEEKSQEQDGSAEKSKTKEEVSPGLKKIKEMEDKAMAYHDSIMPEMNSLIQLRKKLEGQLESSKNSAQAEELKRAIKDLEEAEKRMMNWMEDYTKQYKPIADTLRVEKRQGKLDTLYQSIKALKQHWEKSLSKGEQVFESNKKAQ